VKKTTRPKAGQGERLHWREGNRKSRKPGRKAGDYQKRYGTKNKKEGQGQGKIGKKKLIIEGFKETAVTHGGGTK